MAGKTFVFIVLVAITSVFGQELLARLGNSVRGAVDTLSNSPMVDQASQFSADFISNTVDLLTFIPITIARNAGGGSGFPSLINENNIGSSIDDILSNYNEGLTNNDVDLSFDKLVVKYGYPLETHQVVTEDGYNLTMFRIPGNGSVIFLMHGLLGSSDDYILAGPESGLAYLLSKEGYDVWLGNGRGNKHSRNHIKLKPSQGKFWDFSWHEIGYYDLPAMIDYVIDKTGESKIKYIGHSQGTTTFFVMASERPEYNDKIKLMVAMAPSAFVSRMKSPVIRLFAPYQGILHSLSKTFGVYELGPDNKVTRLFRRIMCGTGPLAEIICANVFFVIAGFDFPQMNITNLPVIQSHMPAGASAQQGLHYAQNFLSKKFRKFDYGVEENLKRYGTKTPPSYKLNKITAPVALLYSDGGDWFVHPKDVEDLAAKLPNVIDKHIVEYKNFNHFDFLMAKDVKYLIFKRLRNFLTNY